MKLFKKSFWKRFKVSGEPISLSVLGNRSLGLNQLHPLVAVINSKSTDLLEVGELIAKLTENPEESGVGWDDVYRCDFSLDDTYVTKERERAWTQASMTIKAFKQLKALGPIDKVGT